MVNLSLSISRDKSTSFQSIGVVCSKLKTLLMCDFKGTSGNSCFLEVAPFATNGDVSTFFTLFSAAFLDLVLLRYTLMFVALNVDGSAPLKFLESLEIMFVALDGNSFISFELLDS